MSYSFSRENSLYSVFEIVCLGRRTSLADVDVAIVNATVVLKLAGSVEDSRLGSDGGFSAFHQDVLRVAQRRAGKVVFSDMVADPLGIFGRVRIDDPEIDVARCEFRGNPLQLRGVAIGDGAIRTHEQKDPSACVGREGVLALSIKIGHACQRRASSTQAGSNRHYGKRQTAKRHALLKDEIESAANGTRGLHNQQGLTV